MKAKSCVLLILLVLSIECFLVGRAHGQSTETPSPVNPASTCTPAPCVLPPTQASEGGSIVTDSPIANNPIDQKELLLGSFDGNCGSQSFLGFHLSRDGGSTWQRIKCMDPVITKYRVYRPSDEPSVGYDRNGVAYIAGIYFFGSDRRIYGLLAVQESTDGITWSKPVAALRPPGLGQTYPFETSLAVDRSPGSPWVNAAYVSGVMRLDQGYKNQVVVSHSTDGGAIWTQAAVDPVQVFPEQDRFTRAAVGKDGTVFVTWMHCRYSGHDICGNGIARMMFSKSADRGNTWSPPQRMAAVTMNWALPNTNPSIRVYNYPVIGVDNSNGPHSGNLYAAMETWTGAYLRVQVTRSTDGGTHWSKPVPLAPASDTHDQFFPAISVSPTGKVGVSWLDRRNDPNNIDYQAFAAISDDGGRSFGTNWQLTTAFSNPDTTGFYGWMGDYTGNTWAGPDFIAAWMDSSNGIDMQEVIGGIRLK